MSAETFTALYSPQRPYATDNLMYGIGHQQRSEALQKRFIQANVKTQKNLIVIDLDVEDAEMHLKSLIWDDEVLPEPAYITTNPATSHCQAGWFIDGMAGTARQLFVFKQIQDGFAQLAGGDPHFTGLMMRNPLSEYQITEWINEKVWSFSELLAFLPESMRKAVSKPLILISEETEILGRNHWLFENARKWAYSAYYQTLINDVNTDVFESLLAQRLQELNAELSPKLPASEVRSVNRSILKFLYSNFSLDEAKAKQEAGRVKSLKTRQAKAEQKYLTLKEIVSEGHSLKLACDTLGFNYGSVRKSWKGWCEQWG